MNTRLGFSLPIGALLFVAGCSSQSGIVAPPAPAPQQASPSLGPVAAEPVSGLSYKSELKRQAVEGIDYESGKALLDAAAERLVPAPNAAAGRAHHAEGLRQLASNENLAAIRSFSNAVINAPDNPEYYLQLGRAHLTQKGWDNRAMAAFASGLDLAPDSAALHFAHGDSLWRLTRLVEALEEFEAAVVLDPEHSIAWVRLANGRYLTKDYAGAWEAVQAAESVGGQVPAQMRSKLIEKL